MDDINFVLLVSRWLHIAAAIVAIGGGAFVRFALLPSASTALREDARQSLHDAIRARWARIVHACIALLLVTGAVNFFLLVLRPGIEPMPYHAIFGAKFVAALVVFFIASALVGRSPGFAGMRSASGKWLSVLLILAGVIVLLSGVLNQLRASSTPKEPTATASWPGELAGRVNHQIFPRANSGRHGLAHPIPTQPTRIA